MLLARKIVWTQYETDLRQNFREKPLNISNMTFVVTDFL